MTRREFTLTTLNFYPNRNPRLRLFALWYFCTLIVVWNIAGATLLGFEQSYAHPLTGVATAVAVQLLIEWIDARAAGRRPRFAGGPIAFINALPPAIISGLACSMLLYPNQRLAPVMFASGLSIASKALLRAPVGEGQTQHVFNPSNLGITATLLLIPSVGLAPPYQFTENLTGAWHWILPGIILLAGFIVHGKFTGRFPLVVAWVVGFIAQGLIRSTIFGIPPLVPFVPMTSAAFTLFTLFMIPDPATTPIAPRRQVAFGLAVAAVYGTLFVLHVVFGLFIALAAVSALRGATLWVAYYARKRRPQEARDAGMATAVPTA
jgi:hypothetical protein